MGKTKNPKKRGKLKKGKKPEKNRKNSKIPLAKAEKIW
jgi:hypothetical protein